MTPQKKKIIWTITTVSVVGITVYSNFIHQPEDKDFNICVFCSIRNAPTIMGFVTALCAISTISAYKDA